MFDIIYSKKTGKVFLSQNSNNRVRITPEDAAKIFPKLNLKDIGIWHTNADVSLYSKVIPIDNSGLPKNFDKSFDKLENCKYIPSEKINRENSKLTMWRGPFFSATGYGNMNREICLRLIRNGCNIKLEFFPSPRQIEKEIYDELNKYKNLGDDNGKSVITGFVPIIPKGDNRYQIYYTMIESSSVHPEFINRIQNHADEVWVPTHWNAKMFADAGVTKPINVFPLGVDERKFDPSTVSKMDIAYRDLKTLQLIEKPKTFKFMSVFRWAFSKSPDLMVKAFAEEFKASEDVCLIICSHSAAGKRIRGEIFSYLEGIPNYPSIYLYTDILPVSMMPNLYKNADVYIAPSRGEGMNLPILESAAMEVPVISAYNTAMTDFLTEKNSYFIQTDEYIEANESLKRISAYYHGQKFPKFGRKAIDEMRLLMRHVYKNYNEAKMKAKQFKQDILEKYTWDIAVRNIMDRINKGFDRG